MPLSTNSSDPRATEAWPKLHGPSVFVAAPGDVKYLRDAVIREFEALRRSVTDDHAVKLYDWVVDKAEDGFDAWRPAQAQIPLPSDPFCRAVICIFGERVGTELPEDFPLAPILPALTSRTEGPRLVHPLTEDALESGGFGLSGSVFECLAALAANDAAVAREQIEHGRPPVLILVVGDETIVDEGDPLDANWGWHRLLNAALTRFPKPGARRRWEDAEYWPQIKQLRNLIGFFSREGIGFRIVPDEAAVREEARRFLERALDLRTDASRVEPFKGLSAYAEGDASVFFGRAGERTQAVEDVARLFEDPARPTAYGIVGGSGAGKSSLLRAGLVAHLVHSTSAGSYCAHVIRPSDLLRGADGDDGCTVLRTLVAGAHCAIVGAQGAPAVIAGIEDAAQAVELLTSALHAKGPGWRLLVGFDQFEELLDEWVDPERKSRWMQVVQFVVAAAHSPRIGVLYTMQSNRMELVTADTFVGPALARGASQTLAFPMAGLAEIISGPFSRIGVQLTPELVNELRRKITNFAQSVISSAQGSLLPLVSVALQRLRHKFAEVEGKVLTADQYSDFLEVGDAIGEVASEALDEAVKASGPVWYDDAVGETLRPLVRVGGAGMDHLSLPLAVAPRTPAAAALVRALVRHRLVLDESGHQIRLVHEAVLDHWPKAAEWLKSEQRVLALANIVSYRAQEWHRAGCRPDDAQGASLREVDEAAELLWFWRSVYYPAASPLSATDRMTRDYGLALLRAHPQPGRVIEASPRGATRLHLATATGEIDLLASYLELSPDCISIKDRKLRSALFDACGANRSHVLELLLAAKSDPDIADVDGWRPLHSAAWEGNVASLRALQKAGARILEPEAPRVCPPLQLAAERGHLDFVRELLAFDVPVETSFEGQTALGAASRSGAWQVVAHLAEHGASVEARAGLEWTPLHTTAYFGYEECVRVLLEAGAPVTLLSRYDAWNLVLDARLHPPRDVLVTPLLIACDRNELSIVRRLLEAKADPDQVAYRLESNGDEQEAGASGNSRAHRPLHLAADRGQAALVELLASFSRNIDAATEDGETPLSIALHRGHIAVARALCRLGADVDGCNEHSGTLLQQFAEQGNITALEFLISAGAHAGRSPANTEPAAILAVKHAQPDALRVLLSVAEPFAHTGEGGRTALHAAAEQGNAELTHLLLSRGAPVLARDEQGQTALHLAVVTTFGNPCDVVQSLLSESLELLHLGDVAGVTPLHRAAQAGHTQVVALLLAAGARVDQRCESPTMTPLQMASEVGRVQTMDQLLDAGADAHARSATKGPPIALAARNLQYSSVRHLLDRIPASMAELRAHAQEAGRSPAVRNAPLRLDEILIANRVSSAGGDGMEEAAVDAVSQGAAIRSRLGAMLWGGRRKSWPLPALAGTQWRDLEPAAALEVLCEPGVEGMFGEHLAPDAVRALLGYDGVFEARLPGDDSCPRSLLLVRIARRLQTAGRATRLLEPEHADVSDQMVIAHLAFYLATLSAEGCAPSLFEPSEKLRLELALSEATMQAVVGLATPVSVTKTRDRRAAFALRQWQHALGGEHELSQRVPARQWMLDGVVRFGDGLFRCTFQIDEHGDVTLLEDSRLARGLGGHVEMFSGGIRSRDLEPPPAKLEVYHPPLPSAEDPDSFRAFFQAASGSSADPAAAAVAEPAVALTNAGRPGFTDIPLRLSTTKLTPNALQARGPLARQRYLAAPMAVREAVLWRDGLTCRACGYRSPAYQEAVTLGDNARDIDQLVTLCPLCAQCFRLDELKSKTATLIHLPNVRQQELHWMLRELYVARTLGASSARASALLARLAAASRSAIDLIGTDSPLELARRLELAVEQHQPLELADRLRDIRLLSLGQIIVPARNGLRGVDWGFTTNLFPRLVEHWKQSLLAECPGRAPALPYMTLLEQRLADRES